MGVFLDVLQAKPSPTPTPTPPQAPARAGADIAPVAGQPSSYQVIVQRQNGPTNVMEYRALLERRSELGDQLTSAQERRHELASQLLGSDPSARAGLQARIKVLDDRILRLEGELDQTGDAIANASPEVIQAMRNSSHGEIPANVANQLGNAVIPLAGMFSVFFMLPIAIAFARLLWKRGTAQPARAAISDAATTQRLEQLQQSVDTIALEVERISEGQRYVAKLYAEKDRPAIGA
jgi:hypothetical protein